MENIKYASFWRRLFANLIDSFILMAIGMGISLVLGRDPFDFKEMFETVKTEAPVNNLTTLDYVFTFLISAFFILFFWVKHNGQTPGKKALHIKIVKEDGGDLDWGTAFVRYLCYFVSMIPLYLGFLWVIWDKKKQAFHDKIAKTVVIEADEQKPNKLIYACGCLLPILFVIIGGAAGVLIAIKENQKQTNLSAKQMNTSVKKMDPQAKTHYDRSQELFNQIKELQKKETETGVVQQIKALNDENIAEIKKAIEIEPNNPELWVQLSSAYTWISTKGTLEDAYLANKKAVELVPDNVAYNNWLGYSLIQIGKYDEAILVLQKSIRMDDGNGAAYQSLGLAYEKLKIYDQARTNYQKALEIFEKINEDGKYDQTILDVQKSLARLPK